MNLRQDAAARTRSALIDSGLRLAERVGLAGLSVNALVEELGVAKGTFFHHFGSRAGYLLALHREFHDRLETVIATAMAGHDPGYDRLLAGTTAYLDACLRDRGVKALLLEARAEPLVADEAALRNARSAAVGEPDFAALGWPHPHDAARLWVGLVAEAALLELQAGQRQPGVRETLTRYLRDRPANPG
ncbi:TetR/AcrR family transcriptional regulator [Nocardia sp. alder85J]|uniref:TetR/AcrR family transcriptional regulator n=1 Tax=Nocardia sp. alder85J TaxID=2862949 RepID=UPI001CD4ADCD|nr:TetR/AcrR family transcriptional regulator [Nocardia sp. alder85J]MCX4097252.1 TetR/AcrR family transcriptional regulator [Nocardia sp. alder85J]